MNRCPKCTTCFTNWQEYSAHMISNKCFKKILPEKTSNRTKQEIVRDMEATKLKDHLI